MTQSSPGADEFLRMRFDGVPLEEQREAVRRAIEESDDGLGDLDRGYAARRHHLWLARALPSTRENVAIQRWLLDRRNEDSRRFYYNPEPDRWVVHDLTSTWMIPRAVIHAARDELVPEFRLLARDTAPPRLRFDVAVGLNDHEVAREQLAVWRKATLAKAPRFEQERTQLEAEYLRSLATCGDSRRAIAISQPIVASHHIPKRDRALAMASMIMPARHAGKNELAFQFERRSYRLVRSHPRYFRDLAPFVRYAIEVGNSTRAVELIEKHRPWGDSPLQSDKAHLLFALAARRAFLELRHSNTRALSGVDDAVINGLIEQAEFLSNKFDQRDGRSTYSEILERDMSQAES